MFLYQDTESNSSDIHLRIQISRNWQFVIDAVAMIVNSCFF